MTPSSVSVCRLAGTKPAPMPCSRCGLGSPPLITGDFAGSTANVCSVAKRCLSASLTPQLQRARRGRSTRPNGRGAGGGRQRTVGLGVHGGRPHGGARAPWRLFVLPRSTVYDYAKRRADSAAVGSDRPAPAASSLEGRAVAGPAAGVGRATRGPRSQVSACSSRLHVTSGGVKRSGRMRPRWRKGAVVPSQPRRTRDAIGVHTNAPVWQASYRQAGSVDLSELLSDALVDRRQDRQGGILELVHLLVMAARSASASWRSASCAAYRSSYC